MTKQCTHLDTIRTVTPSALGCEECLKTGDAWFHLRICRTCGHVGCCDQSPEPARDQAFSLRPAIRSLRATIRRKAGDGAMSTKGCSISPTARRPHNGPIPRYY